MPEPAEAPSIQLTTSLEDVFNKAFKVQGEEEPAKTPPEGVQAQPEPPGEPPKPPEPPKEAPPEAPEPEREPKKPAAEQKAPETEAQKSISDLLLAETPEKPAETSEAEPKRDEPPPELKGRARENFQKLADSKYQLEVQLREEKKARTQAEERATRGDPDAKAQVAQLQAQLKQYDSLVERANLVEHPQFQARFVIPRQQLLDNAKTAYQDAGGDPSVLETALTLKGKARADKLDEILGEVTSNFLRGKIERAAEGIENLDGQREQVLKNQAVVLKKLQEQDQVTRHQQLMEYEKATLGHLDDAKRVLRDEYKLEIFKPVEDPKFSWWNEEIDKMDKAAEHIMLKVDDPREMAIAARLAVAAPRYRTLFLEEHKARVKAEAELREFKTVEPSLVAGKDNGQPPSEEEEDKRSLSSFVIESVKKAS